MDSIIFDLDGTLWDSSETVARAWNRAVKDDERVKEEITMEDLKATMGLQMKEIGDKLFPYLSEEERADVLSKFGDIENGELKENGGELYNALEDVLRTLAERYKLFIVSNCQEGYIEAFYHYHGLEKYFIDYENPGRTGLSKGENIKLVIERNNLEAPVYVGDTHGDQQAAKHAGIPFIFAAYGFGTVDAYDDVILEFKELKDLFVTSN